MRVVPVTPTLFFMDPRVEEVLASLQRAADEHDAGQVDRLARWRVIEPDAGRLLWFLVQALQAQTLVEVGTSRGASTLWLADAARRTGGRVTSYDLDGAAQQDARRAIEQAGLDDVVDLRQSDGGAALAAAATGSVDLLLLDSERTEYTSWWPHPLRVLRPRGVLAVDNAVSHAEEVAGLRDLLAADEGCAGVSVHPVGKGQLLAIRRG